jgi:hypothetical protein
VFYLAYNTLNVTLSGADAGKFTLSGGRSRDFKLTFEATDFEARSNAAYSVKVKAIVPDFLTLLLPSVSRSRLVLSSLPLAILKSALLVVKVRASSSVSTSIALRVPTKVSASEPDANAKVTAQSVRKESKSASKLLLSKVGRTLMGRLSYIRHKNKQESSFSASGLEGVIISIYISSTEGANQGADGRICGKISISSEGYQLTFEATDFSDARSDARSDAYRVKVQATFIQRFFTGDIMSTETVDKTITVTVADLDDEAPTNIQISDTDLPANSPVPLSLNPFHLPFLQR